jgi:hypothetical protein
VVSQRNGLWGRAIEVPGLSALNADGSAQVGSVSCASAGNCTANGSYLDRSSHRQGFVVSQRNGVWGQAIEIPGLATLNKGRFGRVGKVSCASPGNCVAGGYYSDRRGHVQGFVASQRNGAWGRATGVPGLGVLNKGEIASVDSVSCASAGNCTAGGAYRDRSGHDQGFLVSERNGVWGRAIGMPALGALDKRGLAEVDSVSCASAGNCAAAGYYTEHSGADQGFVVSERNGVWGRAIKMPAPAA